MLLIHLLPYNRDNYPWCVDIVSVNAESYEEEGRSRIVVTPPAGICPSPAFAVSFDCDCIETVKNHGLKPSEAAPLLADILKKHEQVVFSNAKSCQMFRELLVSLQMTDVLRDKTVSSFKSILHAAVTLKNIYYPKAWCNIKKLCSELGFAENRYIGCMYRVFADLYGKAPKLLSYFVKRDMVLGTAESSGRIVLGITEDGFRIITPVMVTRDYILGMDISKEVKPCVLPLNGSVCYTVSSAINGAVAQSLGTDFESIKRRFAEALPYCNSDTPEHEKLMSGLGELLKNADSDDTTAVTDEKLRRLTGLVPSGRVFLGASEVSAYVGKVTGPLRTAMLDYLYLEEYPFPLGYEDVYRDIVASRINGARNAMVSELEYATAEAEKNGSKESLSRLSNLYRFLSE